MASGLLRLFQAQLNLYRLNVFFLYFYRPEEIKETSLDDRQLLLDFEAVPLASCPRTILVLTNTSAIQASFTIEMNYFRAAKPPTPPDGKKVARRVG